MANLISGFPKRHALIACMLAIPLMSFLVAESPGSDKKSGSIAAMAASTIPLPHISVAPAAPASVPDADETSGVVAAAVANSTEHREVVKSGDSLARIFSRLSLSPTDLHDILETGAAANRLKRIYPGEQLTFVTTNEQQLLSVSYSPSPLETLEFHRADEGFTANEIVRQPDRVTSYRHGVIDQSLFVATQHLGLNDDVALRLAQIFQWDIDFVLDIRKGDEFFLLFEEKYVDDTFIGFGKILAAEFVNQGKTYRAIVYTHANGDYSYYTPEGESMRKAFLRAPVEFTRISSNFSLRRFHPIHKRVIPHRGIDYAAPSGTPVLASGDGRVKIAGRTSANGNYVVLQHGEQFETKYLHLSKFARGVGSGRKVRQGQVIGYVGATGWATAPHLHYEFLVNGVHQNPRTVSLPKAHPILAGERGRFTEQSKPLLALLETYKLQVDVASLQ